MDFGQRTSQFAGLPPDSNRESCRVEDGRWTGSGVFGANPRTIREDVTAKDSRPRSQYAIGVDPHTTEVCYASAINRRNTVCRIPPLR